MLTGRDYIVRGRVQGVGYRYFAAEAALRLGIRGFVRNLPGGDVEVHAEAEPGVLEVFKMELERGPRMARVHEVVENKAALTSPHSSFEIRG